MKLRTSVCAAWGSAVLLVAALPLAAQVNQIINGTFEGTFTPVTNSHPLDASTPDDIPAGWFGSESFTGSGAENSAIFRLPNADPGRPGLNALGFRRLAGGASGDETGVRQQLAIDTRNCTALELKLDVRVVDHNLVAGGTVSPAFEWPVFVWIDYTTESGATQIWRHGWYVDPPGDGARAADPGQGLIPLYQDKKVIRGLWDSNHFDLLAELPQASVIDRILVGGSGWNFEGAVDNVEILCTPNLRLADRRFRVDTYWRTPFGETGVGHGVQLTNDSGYFWFFSSNNIELVVKVLDACNPYGRYWVFAAGLTDVEVTLKVKDLVSGDTLEYLSQLGHAFAPIINIDAFNTCHLPDPLPICFTMEGIPTGILFGSPLGQTPGQVVLNESGVTVSVENFKFMGSGSFFGDATVMAPDASPGFGTGQTLFVNNLSFKISDVGLPYPPGEVTFDYADWGGFENLAINGQPGPPFAGEFPAAPCPLGGVTCQWNVIQPPLNAQYGVATFKGAIHNIQFGGQELYVDNICLKP